MSKRQRNSYGEYLSDRAIQAGRRIANFAGRQIRQRFNDATEGIGSSLGTAAVDIISAGGVRIQNAIRSAAEKATSGLSGGAAMDIGENPILAAQLIPGRGAECASSGMLVLPAIKFKTGEPPGPRLTSAYDRERLLYTPQAALIAFAYKMQLEQPDYVRNDTETPPITRFVVHNVFRHVLAGPNNVSSPTLPYGQNQQSWNRTLGPDRSFVRKLGNSVVGGGSTGSAYIPPPASSGLVDTFSSPFRYPRNGDFMFSRMSRQLMENLGWNANPLKFVMRTSGGSGDIVNPLPILGYENAAMYTSTNIVSNPARIPVDATLGNNRGPSFSYKSQTSQGKLSYNFNNDGTNPVCVEIVITRIKKGNHLITAQLKDGMVEAYQTGYMNYSYANRNQANFSGAPPDVTDVTTNARGPFLPAKALSNYKLISHDADQTAARFNQGMNPFKQVARDQFIVSAGSSRNWSTSLQAMDYFANKFPQYQTPNPENLATEEDYDDGSNCADELTYVVSVAVSGVPAPYVEYNKGTQYPAATIPLASVIDRRGTACSVSVTGAYKEVCHPVYLAQVNSDTYINGRLDIPMYDFPTTPQQIPQLTTNDIANIGQAVRTSDPNSALIGMGPFNTVGGG